MMEYETKNKALTEKLVSAEFNAMITDMINIYSYYGDSYEGVSTVFNKYDDYKDIEPYVDTMRKDDAKVKICLDLHNYNYVVNNMPVSGPAMSYYCLQAFKDGSVDTFIAKYANNPDVRQKAREDMVAADKQPVIAQEDLDKLKKQAKMMGEEAKKEMENYERRGDIPTAEDLNRWNNKDKDYEAFIYAVNDGKFTESKTYLELAFGLEQPVVPPEIKTIIYKAVDDSFTYYSTINKDLDVSVDALADLFLNIYPTMLEASLSTTYGHRGTRLKVLQVLSEAFYKKLTGMGYVQIDLDNDICSLRDAIVIASNGYNDILYLDDKISTKIKGNKEKLKGLDEVYTEIVEQIDSWGYTYSRCLQDTTSKAKHKIRQDSLKQ
jgi:hypothetical protein